MCHASAPEVGGNGARQQLRLFRSYTWKRRQGYVTPKKHNMKFIIFFYQTYSIDRLLD